MFRYILPAFALFGLAALGPTVAQAQYGDGLERTCPQVSRNGPFISATCYDASLLRVHQSSLDIRRCGGAGYGNRNGQLMCNSDGFGGGYAPPPPAYYREHRRHDFD